MGERKKRLVMEYSDVDRVARLLGEARQVLGWTFPVPENEDLVARLSVAVVLLEQSLKRSGNPELLLSDGPVPKGVGGRFALER